jgi:hypothetical protein
MTDKINNWYEKLGTKIKSDQKLDKNFKKHHILPNSMICCIGGTGSGKTNSIIDYLARKNDAFYEIIIFNPVSTQEPMYEFLQEQMPEVRLISDINELPSLGEFEDEKQNEKLLIVDDIINMNKKDFKKINEYFTGGRKHGFTVIALIQNYTSAPKIITRNCQYFWVFKLNDNTTIQNIIRNHNIHSIDKDAFRSYYDDATNEPLSFFMVDLKSKDKKHHLRKGFLNNYLAQ